MHTCSLVFPPDPVWVSVAREAVRALLAAVGRGDLADDALLLTSEAVTNAVNACRTSDCSAPVTVYAEWSVPSQLRVLVHDEAAGLPVCAATSAGAEAAETGRGILLISANAAAWGVCRHGVGPGKATWFEVGALTGRA
ncbi:ATP-binding protein [Streptomyces sp. NPDC007100]|uniref:ATP-binding protein n=1 Tax=Streptomyces sp. NPDC007100 TaxID=3155602 RepID=UPI003404B790